jgi:plasmid maintenance system antidote protein VapI
MSYPAVDNLPPVHPGEILRDELEALSMSARKFAEHIVTVQMQVATPKLLPQSANVTGSASQNHRASKQPQHQ